jgi:hypothetical protein
MAPASFPGRRALVVILVLLELVLAALTVLGMATGTDQQFDKGFTPLGFVILVQSLGAFVLLVLAAGLRACVMTWRARYAPLVMWFFVGTLAWLVWAFFRLSEYSS